MSVKTCSLHWLWEAWVGRHSPEFPTVGVLRACPVLSVTEDGATENVLTLPCLGPALRALVSDLCHPRAVRSLLLLPRVTDRKLRPRLPDGRGILNRLSAQTRAHVCSSPGFRCLLQTASVLPAGPLLASSHCVLLSSGRGRFTLKFSVALILFTRLCFHIDVRLICLIIQTAIKLTNKTL